jgi:hypothetical protein
MIMSTRLVRPHRLRTGNVGGCRWVSVGVDVRLPPTLTDIGPDTLGLRLKCSWALSWCVGMHPVGACLTLHQHHIWALPLLPSNIFSVIHHLTWISAQSHQR